MVKKLFALASVTALAGIVSAVGAAGCSETVVEDSPTDAGSPDTGAKKDAAPPDEEPEPDPTCLTKDPVDMSGEPYKTALKSPGACTSDEQTTLTAYFKAKVDANEDVKVSEWSKEVSDDCAKCIFSDGTGDTWGPIITKDDKIDTVNQGGCYEIATGKESCGRAFQQYTACRIDACLVDCKTQEEFTACIQDQDAIYQGPCSATITAVQKECGNNLQGALTACKNTAWTFDAPIKSQCVTGGGQADAGDGG
ncbi:MAG: hypothetical protein KF850_09610 [Labilithrix sp.]|nr:hypothetical protein [Labilithrix sp.]